VAEVLGLRFSGFLAWWLWRTVYLMKMPGWGRRLKVASSWTLDLVLPPDLVQLRLGGSQGLTREHYEPGEEVFREGDLGDCLYIVLSGEAEVVKGAPGREETLARLGAGEVFGEMALLRQTARNATVRCRAAMDVLRMPQQEFAALAAHLPDLRESVERVMEGRRRTGEE
jgi:NADH dehydrogenase